MLCVYGWILHVVHVFVESVELRLHSLDEMVWLHVFRVYVVILSMDVY